MANKVVGIRFKKAGKKYYFDPQNINVDLFDKVVVETIRGIELGEVIEAQKEIEDDEIISTLKPILRKANAKDLSNYERNVNDTPKTVERIAYYIKKNKLEM